MLFETRLEYFKDTVRIKMGEISNGGIGKGRFSLVSCDTERRSTLEDQETDIMRQSLRQL